MAEGKTLPTLFPEASPRGFAVPGGGPWPQPPRIADILFDLLEFRLRIDPSKRKYWGVPEKGR
jgi:hypothetical protein